MRAVPDLNMKQKGKGKQQHDRPIYSRTHPKIKHIRDLHSRKKRDEKGVFFAQGLRFVVQAIESGSHIEHAVLAPELLPRHHYDRNLKQFRRMGIPLSIVTKEVFHSLSFTDNPQGIGAVVRQKVRSLKQIDASEGLCWLAFTTIQSPGNFGTIMRSATAVGAAGAILLSHDIDPYDPGTVRASMGSIFYQRIVRTSLNEFLRWKRQNSCLLVGTSPDAVLEYRLVSYCPQPTILLMGGERKGISKEHQEICDGMVKIPMVGTTDSLNLAIATSVMLYEIFNQSRSGREGG